MADIFSLFAHGVKHITITRGDPHHVPITLTYEDDTQSDLHLFSPVVVDGSDRVGVTVEVEV